MVGTRLAQYIIESEIGAGGMGVVYRAFDERLQRPVALKVFKNLDPDSRGRQRLLHEARSASALNHPHVCTIHEAGECDGVTFLVMEFIEATPLNRLIPPGGLPPETVARYGSHVASALAHAHARGVIHRDLKSANIVVTSDDLAKVLDFGLALRDALYVEQTQAMTADSLFTPTAMAGTVPYMPPEALRGEPMDARGDAWGLGVVLCEMSAGALPFVGRTAFDTMIRILNTRPELPRTLARQLRAVIDRCMTKDPSQRQQSAREVGTALDATMSAVSAPPSAVAARRDKACSVAVLPFANLSPDPESDYFSDGLTDEIITDLSNVHLLRVISRTSSMRFKGSTKPIADLARDLRVDYVLEGSVRRAGPQLRVTATLVDVASDSTVWGQKYTGALDDVFAIQETISRAIVDALRLTLTKEEDRRLAERHIRDVRAYEWYLRAKQEMLRFTSESLGRAIEYLEKASAIEGENVLLLAATGEAYWQYVNAGISADPTYLDKADAYAQRVLALDPRSPHRHRVAGLVLVHRGKMQPALRELTRALELDPHDVDSLMWGSLMAGMSGKSAPAEAGGGRLGGIDPLTPLYPALPRAGARGRAAYEKARRLYAANEAAVMETPILRL